MLIILLLLPLITMIVINLNRDKLENDRNFYGKECSVDQLKVTKNGYEKYQKHYEKEGIRKNKV